MKAITIEWLQKASEDLLAAQLLAKHAKAPPRIIALHCQQAIEKSMKGFLDEKDFSFEKTHDLEILIDSCVEADSEFKGFENNLNSFQPYAVIARYPEADLSLSKEEIAEMLEIAEKMLKFVS